MPSHSDYPRIQTPDLRIMLAHFIHQIEARHISTPHHPPVMLHFDSQTGALVEYKWPCDLLSEERFTPADLERIRRTHYFKNPCCLCAYLDGEAYTEARIGVVETLTRDPTRNQSVLHGEYVAVCARQRCGYFLCLERFYTIPSLELQACRRRSKMLSPEHLFHVSDVEKSFREGDGLFQVMTNVNVRGSKRALQKLDPYDATKQLAGVFEELIRGVTQERFYSLFVQCLPCKQVMFREFFVTYHACLNHKANRYHPYRRTKVPVISTLVAAAADLPEACPSSASRAGFLDEEDLVDTDAEGDPESDDTQQDLDYPGVGSDDSLELPTIPELIRAHRFAA